MRIYGRHTESILNLAARLEDVDVGIRWGGGCFVGALNGSACIWDGLEQLEILSEAGIHVPFFTEDKEVALRLADPTHPQHYPVMGRKRNHTQGRDIRFSNRPRIRGQRRWYNSDYFVVFLPSIAEWRFHIFKGNSIGRGKKVYTLDGPEPEYPIRSRKFGYKMIHNESPPKFLREMAKKAVEALGYDFGAVDLLETESGGVVLEVNSRPGLRSEYTLNAYEKAIRNFYNG